MNIVKIEYSIATRSLDIFCSGCNPPFCVGCYNLEVADFKCGKHWTNYIKEIRSYLKDFNGLIKNVFLLGGSFNHQKLEELEPFMEFLEESLTNEKVWLFAREELLDIQQIFKDKCHYIKCGEYKKDLVVKNNIQYGIVLSTSNQIIYKNK